VNRNLPGLSVILLSLPFGNAWSAVVARIEQKPGGVIAFYSGSVNLDGLQLYSASPVPSSYNYRNVQADLGRIGIGGVASFLRYRGVTGPREIGASSPQYVPTSSTGQFVGIYGSIGHIWVPVNYISETPMSGTASWDGTTLASMGLSVGEYIWTWGIGSASDSFSLIIVPESSSTLFLVIGALGFASRRHRINQTTRHG
jgi:hypothetical protein